ncbi:MAG: hypothetical protein ACKOAO_06635, partial [Oxalobacteraceae bacterium]
MGELFETKDEIKKRDSKSKAALLNMASMHPKIAAMLGNSVISKSSWTAREFRQGIDVKQTPIQGIAEKKDPLPEYK